MQLSPPNAPVPYDAGLETAEPSEEATGAAMVETLNAHRPLGSINRVRKATYEMSAGFRRDHVRCPVQHVEQRERDGRRTSSSGR